jgi:hypothetical protein
VVVQGSDRRRLFNAGNGGRGSGRAASIQAKVASPAGSGGGKALNDLSVRVVSRAWAEVRVDGDVDATAAAVQGGDGAGAVELSALLFVEFSW